ncbi:NYN domain-containing protein [Mycolicibacterium goodii]|uniref:RNA-binding protein n=1 Tax=Mycolicibacterium goodii TaxID=134601 RepID=A0A0K0XGL8_MYCGD|nr:RNA-binding protein [Mycolicibacterium goodii]
MHWIVDGMNVIGSRPDGWWRDRRAAMVQLVDRLERWASIEKVRVTVVFEAPTTPLIESSIIGVTHAPESAPNSADDEIIRLLDGDPDPSGVTVATSDRGLAERVRATGAHVHPASGLRHLLDDLAGP